MIYNLIYKLENFIYLQYICDIPYPRSIFRAKIQIFSSSFFVIREIFVVFAVNLNKLFKTREKSEINKQQGRVEVMGGGGGYQGVTLAKGCQTNRMKCAKRQFLITNSPQHLTRFCCLQREKGAGNGGTYAHIRG